MIFIENYASLEVAFFWSGRTRPFRPAIFAQMDVGKAWPSNILSKKILCLRFYHSKRQSMVKWKYERSYVRKYFLFSEKVTESCEFTAAFPVGLFFFKEIGSFGPVTCDVNRKPYGSVFSNQFIPTKCRDENSTGFIHNLQYQRNSYWICILKVT